MALTLLRKIVDNKIRNIVFKTETVKVDNLDKLVCRMYMTDDTLKTQTNAIPYEIDILEEKFHKDLREKSAKYNHLVTSHSTNPEWNPVGYKRTLNDFKKDEKNRK